MATPESLILYERDDDGVPFAVEEVRATRWDIAFTIPPDPAIADVRVVHLARGPLPARTPSWLAVDLMARATTGVAESATSYVADTTLAAPEEQPRGPRTPARRLWAWSPHHRRASSTLDEFLRAGATALRHPEPLALDHARQAEALRAFARGRDAFAPLIALRSLALERWLQVVFAEPEAFADAILLARIETIAPGDAALLRFLREAAVPRDLAGLADLAIDRMVLLEQASPWRYLERVAMHPGDVEGGVMPAAFASVRSWQRRYVNAYAEHYRRAIDERDHLLRDVERHIARLSTFERLNRIAALHTPEGEQAIAAAHEAIATLTAMPEAPDTHAAITARVRLGEGSPAGREFRCAMAEVEGALEARLRRLSAALAACALEHDDDLTAILNAIAVSEVDHLDRVLDDQLAARVDGLLRRAPRSPLAVVAQQFPELTHANLEAAVDEFRRAARCAIEAAPDGRASLVATPQAVLSED